MPSSASSQQFLDACQLTGATWAARLEGSGTWVIRRYCHLNQNHRIRLLAYVNRPSIHEWINRGIVSNRVLAKTCREDAKALNCQRLYIFPNQSAHKAIIVGAKELSIAARRFWREVSLGDSDRGSINTSPQVKVQMEMVGGVPSHSPEAINQVLDLVMCSIGSQTGWLGIRSGDHLDIKGYSRNIKITENKIPIDSNPLLREIMHNRSPRIVRKNEVDWAMVPRHGYSQFEKYWAAFPLIIGRRIIGLIGLWVNDIPEPGILKSTNQLAINLAPFVEGNILFEDLSNQVRRMALLNDFSVTISSATDVDLIVKRLFALIQRTFDTNRIILITHSKGETTFHRYLMEENSVNYQLLSSEEETRGPRDREEILRVDSIPGTHDYSPFYPESTSALALPLKYHRQAIGMLCLENTKEAAFSRNDESLLAIIASHLAGLLENGRLRQEAESRAVNLGLIHSVVEHVIGLTDANQVAQIASELIAKNFAYELTCIALLNEDNDLHLLGVGGSAANTVKSHLLGKEASHRQGIVGHVLLMGQSILVNDVTRDTRYTPLPNWEAGSEMCVALKNGEAVLGIIDVESRKKDAFSANDLLVLESLAGILSSVISNTGQFRQLQTTVDQLQNTRMELQERITAQKVAESRLVQAAKLAAVGEMAAGIAHELNNPLTTVTGFTELTLEGLPEHLPIRTDLELVLKEAQRARDVVRRLLDFARQSESARTSSDVNEIVFDVLNLTQHLLHTSGVMLKTNLAEGLPWVSIDRNQIKQVVLNLMHNSMHAMPGGGILSVTTSRARRDKHDGVQIVIKDTGIGIPPDQVERIFEPFFTTRSKEGGTGLGLSVSYGIVVDHGGDISVDSTVGKGSTFTVWLPK